MGKAIEYLKIVESFDRRQQSKVQHKLSEIVGISFLAMIANANDPEEIEIFCKGHEELLREYFILENGIPSHDTIQRAFEMVSSEYLQGFRDRFNELLNANEGELVRKLLSIDGKTQRGNGNADQKANHIVSAVDEEGFCLGEVRVDEKSNEITAIPELLSNLNIKGHIITTDAMGTQREIAKLIRNLKADYVLALKGNQSTLYDDVRLYFEDKALLSKCSYHRTVEKARGGVEVREYWQTEDIGWLAQRKEWAGLKSIAMTRSTITRNGKTTTEKRHFISSLNEDVKEIARAIRGHWMVESYHWSLDVTFREDADRTLNKHVAYNLNILRKLALNLLKMLNVNRNNTTITKKRFMIGCDPKKYFERIFAL